MQTIHDVLALIPEDSVDEALFAIESITIYPAVNKARLRVYPMNDFRLHVSIKNGVINIDAENKGTVCCNENNFVSGLQRTIYTIDEEMTNGSYTQTPPREQIIYETPQPPGEMDIPIWDAAQGAWRDAEY